MEGEGDGAGWRLDGTIVAASDNGPAAVIYLVVCDAHWRTRQAHVSLRDGAGERTLDVQVAGDRWSANGAPRPDLAGCVDIDLGWSPSTNTLPIRRLSLAVGAASGPVVAAWVRFPDLTLETLPQEYQHLTADRYRYTSRGGAFTAIVQVDPDGLVRDYEGIWRRQDGGG
jgi:uncharacterized protein